MTKKAKKFEGEALYPPAALANTILTIACDLGKSMTHLQLQKIVFYCHATYMVDHNRPLIDEPFSARIHGPVCDTIYEEFRSFGGEKIPACADYHHMSTLKEDESGSVDFVKPVIENKEARGHVEAIFEKCIEFSGKELSMMTHHQNSKLLKKGIINPWQKARGLAVREGVRYYDLSNIDIRDYYRELWGKKEKLY